VTAPDDEVPFEEDLAEAFCVVTHSSNTAVEAILAGVPAFVLGQSAAQPFACNDLKMIEAPFVLADNQWTLKEIREGKAWADLNG
jgi:UDP:flavonoid glycosyltransferase YjiC (YdhE family)